MSAAAASDPPTGRDARIDAPLALLVAAIVVAAIALPFVVHAPNRLISGRGIGLWSATGSETALGLLVPALVLLAAPFLRPRSWAAGLIAVAAAAFLTALLHAAGEAATTLAAGSASAARTSFGSGFWVMAVAAALVVTETAPRAGRGLFPVILGLLALAPPVVLLASGRLDDLSILREYANQADIFRGAVIGHVVLVAGSVGPALALGIPLGVALARGTRLGAAASAVLAIVQTIPSIALFGLLLAPLAALASAFPVLGALGIRGIGLAPALIALTLYSLLPILRNTAAGLAAVPRDAIEAARGIGMTPRQIFWRVEAPLALPVLLAGLRITLVQAIGLAAVAALIGAGGLGQIMFQGLFANALDLVLLGALPVVAIAVAADAMLAGLTSLAGRSAR